LTDTVFTKLFEKVKDLDSKKYKEHLLLVLEKFDIIVKPYKIQDMTSYYMPCLISPSSFEQICSNFGVHEKTCHRTSWLLLDTVWHFTENPNLNSYWVFVCTYN
jgi:hypothetical protein